MATEYLVLWNIQARWCVTICQVHVVIFYYYYLNIYLFIYLAAPGLSCGTRDLRLPCGSFIINIYPRASLVAQWLRSRLPMQGTWVRALVQEDPTCRGATKPMCHNY